MKFVLSHRYAGDGQNKVVMVFSHPVHHESETILAALRSLNEIIEIMHTHGCDAEIAVTQLVKKSGIHKRGPQMRPYLTGTAGHEDNEVSHGPAHATPIP